MTNIRMSLLKVLSAAVCLFVALTLALGLELATASDGAAAEPIKVRMAIQRTMIVHFYTARKHKLFEEAGLDPEYLVFNAAPPMFAAFRSGDVDIGYMGAPPSLIMMAQGIDVRPFLTEADFSKAEALVVHKDAGINSLADLRGKKIAVWRGTGSDFSLGKAIVKAGLTPKDLTILDVDVTTVLPAFAKRDIDGVYIWDPWALRLEKQGGKLLITDQELGVHMPAIWVGSREWMSNPEGARRFVLAFQKASEIMANNRDSTVKLVAAEMNLDTGFVEELMKRVSFPSATAQADPNHTFSINPEAISQGKGLAQALSAIATFMHSKGKIDRVPDVAAQIDTRPVSLAFGK